MKKKETISDMEAVLIWYLQFYLLLFIFKYDN